MRYRHSRDKPVLNPKNAQITYSDDYRQPLWTLEIAIWGEPLMIDTIRAATPEQLMRFAGSRYPRMKSCTLVGRYHPTWTM